MEATLTLESLSSQRDLRFAARVVSGWRLEKGTLFLKEKDAWPLLLGGQKSWVGEGG